MTDRTAETIGNGLLVLAALILAGGLVLAAALAVLS